MEIRRRNEGLTEGTASIEISNQRSIIPFLRGVILPYHSIF